MHPCRVHFVWNECKRSFRSLLSQVVVVVVVAFAYMREDTVVEGNLVVDKDILSLVLVALVQGSPSLVDNSSSSLVVVVVGTCTVKDNLVVVVEDNLVVVVENSSVLVVKGNLVVMVVLTMEGSSAEVVDIVVVGYCTCWRIIYFLKTYVWWWWIRHDLVFF